MRSCSPCSPGSWGCSRTATGSGGGGHHETGDDRRGGRGLGGRRLVFPLLPPAAGRDRPRAGQRGSHFEAQAQSAVQRRQPVDAQQAYLKASLSYALGYFPDNGTPEHQASYRKHLETYVEASRFFGHTMEVVPIPLDGGRIVVYLPLPARATKPGPT